jgi:hypothetical protein
MFGGSTGRLEHRIPALRQAAGVSGKIMRHFLLLTILIFSNVLYGQKLFDSSKVNNLLLTLPKETVQISFDTNIIKAIEAVDKNFRIIADTLYSYKSLKHTIFQTVLIETNDSIFINPLSLGDRIKSHNIIFYNRYLNIKVDSISRQLTKNERLKLYSYLANSFDNFSEKKREFSPQPVRLRYIKFPDERIVKVGIDIYGTHFLWTIDRQKNWDVIKVEELWVY